MQYVATKADVSALKADVSAVETSIIKWLVGTSITIAALAFAIAKYVN